MYGQVKESEITLKETIKKAITLIDPLFSQFDVSKIGENSFVMSARLDVPLEKFLSAIKDEELASGVETVIENEKKFFQDSLLVLAKKIDPIVFREVSDLDKQENLVLLDSAELSQYLSAKSHIHNQRPFPVIHFVFSSETENSLVINFKVGANKMSPLNLSADTDFSILDFFNLLFFKI